MDKLNLLKKANSINEIISIELNKYINKKLLKDITTKQHLCLIYIGNMNQATAGKILNILEISKSSTSQLLNRLEMKKLITRELNIHNKKEIIVKLDHDGILYFKKYLEVKEKIISRYFSFLDINEIQALYEINLKVLQHIRKINNEI